MPSAAAGGDCTTLLAGCPVEAFFFGPGDTEDAEASTCPFAGVGDAVRGLLDDRPPLFGGVGDATFGNCDSFETGTVARRAEGLPLLLLGGVGGGFTVGRLDS